MKKYFFKIFLFLVVCLPCILFYFPSFAQQTVSREINNIDFVATPTIVSREIGQIDFLATPTVVSKEINNIDFVATVEPVSKILDTKKIGVESLKKKLY